MVRDYELAGAERTLAEVHPDNVFSAKDGAQINSLHELYAALQRMDDSTFSHHVNEGRNDFSNWVKDVHRDYSLSNSLNEADDRKSCASAVAGRIYELEQTIEQRKSLALRETEMAAERLEKILTEAAHAKSSMLAGGQNLDEKGKKAVESTVTDLMSGATEVVEEEEVEESPTEHVLRSGMASAYGESEATAPVIEDIQKEDIESPLPKKPRIRNEPFRLKPTEPQLAELSSVMKSVDSLVEEDTEDSESSGPSADELIEESEEETAGSIEFVSNDPAEELVKFAEEPRFHRQFANEISKVFSKDSMKSFKDEMKSIFHSGAEAEHEFVKGQLAKASEEPVEVETPEERKDVAPAPAAPKKVGDKKQEMLSHLKRVFK